MKNIFYLFIIILVLFFGCVQKGEATNNETIEHIGVKEECDHTPTKRQFNSEPYYSGPLIDTHIHLPAAFKTPDNIAEEVDWDAPVFDKDINRSQIICMLDKENIKSAFGFYIVTTMLTEKSVQVAKEIDGQYPGRIVPFILPPHFESLNPGPTEIEQILKSNPGLFKGFGEIAMYRGSYYGMSPNDPSLLEIYEVADKNNLIIMMHPDEGWDSDIESMVRDNPNVTFLFHGGTIEETPRNAGEIEKWVMTVVRYPNAYYTIDIDFSDLADDPSCCLFDVDNKEDFVVNFKKNYDKILAESLARWKPHIEKYPDKFLWGTDRGEYAWAFDPEVGGLIEELSRAFIGQLDPTVQEKFAYKNAEKLLENR